eukprot:scaffold85279_cov24-Tisochrysis_lutea.AAC.2
MYCAGFLSASAFSSEPWAPDTFELASASNASRVRSVFSAAASSSGRASSSSLSTLGARESLPACTILPARCPTEAMAAAWSGRPDPSVVSASV